MSKETLHNALLMILLISAFFGTASALYCRQRFEALEAATLRKERDTVALARTISTLARDIRIATYPSECDEPTKKIIGASCDLGNYMEWAGPRLENETEQLLLLLSEPRQ